MSGIEITLGPLSDFAEIGRRWRALEQRADCSFFQSWTYAGCLAEQRFSNPVLLQATQNGRPVALALFNHRPAGWGRPDTLHLNEAGHPSLDSPFIEHNAILMARGMPPGLPAACLRAVAAEGGNLVLNGVTGGTLDAARDSFGRVVLHQQRPVFQVDLAALRGKPEGALSHVSPNTRRQIRRSDRAYAVCGDLRMERAEKLADAHRMLDELAELHQATWQARGQPGCFAEPFFGAFHHTLIDRAMLRQEVDLLRITAGETLVGVLYNFRFRGTALAYQSGFNYALANKHQKPGMTCHHQALRYCLDSGFRCYDLLAGDERYKRSLANEEAVLYWAEAGPSLSPRLLRKQVGNWLRPTTGTKAPVR